MPRYKHTFQFSNFQTLLTLSSFLPSSIPFIIEHTIASATITCNNPNPTHEFSKRKISIHASPISKPFDSSNKFPFPKISHPIFSLPRNIKSISSIASVFFNPPNNRPRNRDHESRRIEGRASKTRHNTRHERNYWLTVCHVASRVSDTIVFHYAISPYPEWRFNTQPTSPPLPRPAFRAVFSARACSRMWDKPVGKREIRVNSSWLHSCDRLRARFFERQAIGKKRERERDARAIVKETWRGESWCWYTLTIKWTWKNLINYFRNYGTWLLGSVFLRDYGLLFRWKWSKLGLIRNNRSE